MRFIPTTVHGVMDYLVGILLIAAPWLFGFSDHTTATAILVALGVGVILYSLFTDYELGLVRSLPMPTHLWLDGLGGALLAVSPWLFGFADHTWAPHVVVGVIEIATAMCTHTRSRTEASPRGAMAAR